MTLAEFKQRVRAAFGPNMERATPANVREFLDSWAHERWQAQKTAFSADPGDPQAPLALPPESAASYEEILREFFANVLSAPNEDALIQLWTFALDMAYAGVEDQVAQQIGGLFADHD